MKSVTLKRMELKNYRCFYGTRVFHADFGKKTRISGKNGSGKSTVMNAVMEVLTGKNADGTQADNVRPIVDGQEVEGVDVERTVVLDIDGKETEIKKTTKQKRERVDGVMQYVPGSNVNSYTVDGISFNQKKLDEFISDNICPPETLLACCNPNAFLSLKSTTDMRAFLEKMAGFDLNEYIKSLGSEFAEVEEITKGHTVEQVMKTLNAQLKKQREQTQKKETEYNYEKGKIPADTNVAELESRKAELDKKIVGLDETEKSLDYASEQYDKKSHEIVELKAQLGRIVEEANRGNVEKRQSVKAEISNLAIKRKEEENSLRLAEMDLKHSNMAIERHKADLQKAQEDWKAYSGREYPEENLEKIKNEVFDESSLICPTCGQDLPEEQADKIRSEFEQKKAKRIKDEEDVKTAFYDEKDKKLTEITESGNKAVVDLKSENKVKEETEQKIEEIKKSIANIALQIAEKQKELDNIPEATDVSENEEYIKVSSEIQKAEEALEAMNNGSAERETLRIKRNDYIRECAKIDAEIHQIQTEKARHEELVSQLYDAFRESSQAEADVMRKRDILKNFSIKKNEKIASIVNPNFSEFQFEFLKFTQDGNPIEACRIVSNGIEYKDFNHSKKILAQADLVRGFQQIQGVQLPVFLDDTESVNDELLPDFANQMILLKVTKDDLKVECIDEYMANLDRSYEQLSKNQTISFSLDELRDMESDDWKPTQKIKDFMERMKDE